MNQLSHRLVGLSLLHGPVAVMLTVGVGASLLALLSSHRDRSWYRRAVPLAVLAAVVLLVGAEAALAVLQPFPDPLPWSVPAWVGAGLLALSLAVAGWRRQTWRRRAVAVSAVLVVLVGAANGINEMYAAFPTVGAALQLPPHDEVPASQALGAAKAVIPPTTAGTATGRPLELSWQAPAGTPATGAVAQVSIPGPRSGFSARPAWVYVPPAYRSVRPPLLPVLVLLGGQPGSPRDWVDAGGLAETMDAFAAAHSGLAPIVVMPDALGAETANPLCMDSRLGQADTYLAVDVPDWIAGALQVDPDHAHWAVAGFSYGGTCALQLAVAHPQLFPTLLDISGQQGPTLGDPATTVDSAFGGDRAAFSAVDPLQELAAGRFTGTTALLAAGTQDEQYHPQTVAVGTALAAAGAAVTFTDIPGGHTWTVGTTALRQALPVIGRRTGLTR